MMTKGAPLGVETTVDGSLDIPKGAGYAVSNEITIEGTPGEKVVLDGIWDSIEEAGDLPVWTSVTLTWTGHEWPWSKIVSKFDVSYQAVHMAEGSTLLAISTLIGMALAWIATHILVILKIAVAVFALLKAADVIKWLKEQAPEVGVGIGAGAVLLAGLILLGGNEK